MQRGRYRSSRRGAHRGSDKASSQRLKGCFKDSSWHCDCTPRLPAVNFTVKKDGPNKGRRFYTCQNTDPKRCQFFLWAEDAQLREQAAVMGNSKTGPKSRDAPVQEGWSAGRSVQQHGIAPVTNTRCALGGDDDTPTPTPSRSPSPSPLPPSANMSNKRNAREAFLDDEEDAAWSVSGELEDEMVRVAAVATPQKAQKTGVYATPATEKRSARRIPWLDPKEPATPASITKKTVLDYFNDPTPSKRPAKTVAFQEPSIDEPETPGHQSIITVPPASPSPIRHRDALLEPADSASSLTNEVLAKLSPVRIPAETLSSIRSILSKHDLRTQGVTKGRDISRLALKAKEAKILELEAKVASLEAEREHDRSIIARLRWKKEIGEEQQEEEDTL